MQYSSLGLIRDDCRNMMVIKISVEQLYVANSRLQSDLCHDS